MTDIFSLCERDKPEEVAALLKEDADLVDETDSVSKVLYNNEPSNWQYFTQDQVSLGWNVKLNLRLTNLAHSPLRRNSPQ